MDQALDDVRSSIAGQIRDGFAPIHEIAEDAAAYARERHGRDDLGPELRRIAAELLEAHLGEQGDWAGPTDCDRLDEAFAALNARGIVARQHFTCCNTCGFAEIWDEVEAEERLRPVEGYVFYHLQLTRRAIETGQLLMAYGCLDEDEGSLRRVAATIVTELRQAGLDASWGGTAGHPIVVDGVAWRRRR